MLADQSVDHSHSIYMLFIVSAEDTTSYQYNLVSGRGNNVIRDHLFLLILILAHKINIHSFIKIRN